MVLHICYTKRVNKYMKITTQQPTTLVIGGIKVITHQPTDIK